MSTEQLAQALRECVEAAWHGDSHRVHFDGTVVFSPHYDFSGLDGIRREEFLGEHDCIVWPCGSGRKWSAYCTYQGSMWFENFDTVKEAKAVCMELLAKVSPNDPFVKAYAQLAAHEAEKAQATKVPFPDATPLLEFREGQWWVKELDLLTAVSSGSKVEVTPDMKRAVAVVHDLLRAVANHRAAPAAPVAVAVPEGFALVPLRMTRAMQDVTEQEGWAWEDLLASAEAITEEQYGDIAAAPAAPAAPDAVCMGRDELINMLDDLVPLLQSHVRSVRDWREQHAATSAPASVSEAPVAVPLTDEELREALRQCPPDAVENLRVRWLYAKDFARAIERTLAARWGIKLEGGQG